MGMAASQARLLSITSRMSDNELRAQLINNAKMRLTDDTSKASEKYVNALNQVQLMMSNKDTLGNEMYQQLTFNNLTAYSSYNNQYGLINKSGELVVSELDAAKYEQALKEAERNPETDALTEFLKQQGLEKDTTSYWESNKLSDDLKTRYEGDVEYDDNGNRISGLHYGYELSLDSTEVMVYETLLNDYLEADKAYTAAVIKQMKEYLQDYVPSGETMNYDAKYAEVLQYNTDSGKNPPSKSDISSSLNYLDKLYSELLGKGVIKEETEEEDGESDTTVFNEAMDYFLHEYIEFDSSGSIVVNNSTDISDNGDGYTIDGGNFIVSKDENGNLTVAGQNGYTVSGLTNNNGEYSFNYSVTETEEDGSTSTETGSVTFTTSPLAAYISSVMDEAGAAEALKTVYRYFQTNVLSQMDRDYFANDAPEEKKAYEEAAKQLSIFIFGEDVGKGDYDKLDDMEWILNSGRETTNLDGDTTITLTQMVNGEEVNVDYQANFEAIKDIYLIDEMIAQYGAPKYTWIDKNNPNENADAKVQWYTNIFNKMNEDGYQKIEKALTESTEWIQYALESGLLSMVQVDDEQQWISTMYSNCSDITEDTIELEITRAEAEYKRETQKIQAKDQRYDLELKNIDTEHESLQTEYDSIKSVIDKNVERNFKMFG